MQLPKKIFKFFQSQEEVFVATMDPDGRIHGSIKGIVGLEEECRIFIVDLYSRQTYRNLKKDPRVSISAMDKKNFMGYTVQGQARIVPRQDIPEHIMAQWEERIIQRISKRVVQGVRAQAKQDRHHEAHLPAHPQYLIEINVEATIDLAPPAARGAANNQGSTKESG